MKSNAAGASAGHSRAPVALLDERVPTGLSVAPPDLETSTGADLEHAAPAPPRRAHPDLKTGPRWRLAASLLLVALVAGGALGLANLIGPERLHQHTTRPTRPADHRPGRRCDTSCAGVDGGPSQAVRRARTAASHTQSDAQDQTATTGLEPVGIPGQWHLIFDDEFNGSTLDTSDWSEGWFGSGITKAPSGEENCEDPAEVSEARGSLAITAIAKRESCGGLEMPYASGLISSNGKFEFTYGAFEARIWLPGNGSKIADWPAFWSDGQDWPTDGEIDTLEGLHGQACYHFHYRSGGGPGGCTTVAGAAGGWHTYAADWERGSITYYYDGRRVWRTTMGVTSEPMYLILSLGVASNLSVPVAPATMDVDYVRVWQHPS